MAYGHIGRMRIGPVLTQRSPVVGVRDHAVAVEHAADVLLRPVARGQLPLQQVACASVQRARVLAVVPRLHDGQHGPRGVDHVGVALQLAVHL